VAPEVGRQVFQLDLGGTGSFEDFAGDAGFSWSAGWTYHADNTLGFGVTVGHNTPEVNTIGNEAKTNKLAMDFTYVTATVHVRAPTRSSFIPHLQAGFGYYNLDAELTTLSGKYLDSSNDDDFGMFFGLGMDYLVAPHLSLGIIGNYHFVSVRQSSPISPGVGDWYDTWDIKAVISVYTR